jgi:hypothetical protein
MIPEKTLESWEAFEAEVASLAEKYQHIELLFRGQKPAPLKEKPEFPWPLATSLERRVGVNYSVAKYYENLLSVARPLETVTGKRWELPKDFEQTHDFFRSPQGYWFMTFLRQNGFPSPLLDWTRSPYVAAFFAFQQADPKDGGSVAIFTFLEDTRDEKPCDDDMIEGDATICRCGRWIGTDKKHFLQQSDYTFCHKREKNGTLVYARHDEVLDGHGNQQHTVIRYLIPVSERKRFLQKLQLMNINPYSLFESTESLLEVIASDLNLV